MREITDHIVPGDPVRQLRVRATDEVAVDGANHRYEIDGFDATNNPSNYDREEDETGPEKLTVLLQRGPIREVGVNGLTHEAMVAIVIDRLRSYQAGPYACEANAFALDYFKRGLHQLQERTRARIARGVEGTSQK